MTFSPSQDPDVTRIFPSDWRSTTMVTLSLVASFSRTFSSMSVLINHFVPRPAGIVDDLLPKNSTARDFFNAMLQRYPNRRLGATTLWAGTSTLYASRDRHGGEVFHDSIAGWFK
jgi:hypothetical protein